MHFEHVTIAGHTLRIARAKHAERPTLLLTNAFPQTIRCWASLWDRLGEHFDLVAVDLPGFGMSDGSAAVMRPSAQASILVALLDSLHIDRAWLVGPDVGAPITLWLAAEHPERVLGLNVYDGPGTWPTDFDPALGAAVRSRWVRWFGARWPMRGYLMRQNFRAATKAGYHHFEPAADTVDEYRTVCFDATKHATALAFLGSYAEALPQLDAKLPTIEAPVLITWGAHDQFVRPINAQRLHARLPNSEVTVFDNAGHFSHEDADQAWLDRLVDFVAANAVAPALLRSA